jgi:hypothetical protein
MKKVLLMLDCERCRRLYEFTLTASEDTSAWWVHGTRLIKMALKDGWARTEDDNSHYCPTCVELCENEYEDMCLVFDT